MVRGECKEGSAAPIGFAPLRPYLRFRRLLSTVRAPPLRFAAGARTLRPMTWKPRLQVKRLLSLPPRHEHRLGAEVGQARRLLVQLLGGWRAPVDVEVTHPRLPSLMDGPAQLAVALLELTPGV